MQLTALTRTLLILVSLLGAGLASREALAQSSSRVVDDVSRRVVKIFGSGGIRGLYAYSTGFLVSDDGYIVTVWSHVLDDRTVSVVLADGRKFTGKIIGAEPQLDLAVLKIDGEGFPFFDLDEAGSADAGTRVLAFSNMFKVATGDEPVSVLHGVVAARTNLTARRGNHDVPYTGPVYVVDAITNNPGSGGGVLTTTSGTLLAMVGKELRNSQTNTWMNYAIPISELKTAINEIRTGKFTPRKTPLDDEDTLPQRYIAADFGLILVPDVLFRTPAFIDKVLPNSAAARAGLKPNDLVVFVNDELVASCRNVREKLGALEPGDTLKLVVRRGTTLVAIELPVEDMPVPAKTPATPGTTDPDSESSDE